jgi:hypothetical protein
LEMRRVRGWPAEAFADYIEGRGSGESGTASTGVSASDTTGAPTVPSGGQAEGSGSRAAVARLAVRADQSPCSNTGINPPKRRRTAS